MLMLLVFFSCHRHGQFVVRPVKLPPSAEGAVHASPLCFSEVLACSVHKASYPYVPATAVQQPEG